MIVVGGDAVGLGKVIENWEYLMKGIGYVVVVEVEAGKKDQAYFP